MELGFSPMKSVNTVEIDSCCCKADCHKSELGGPWITEYSLYGIVHHNSFC